MKPQRGFTLTELLSVLVLVGVLGGIAVPRFIELGRSARVASVTALAGVLRQTANTVRIACLTKPECDYSLADQHINIAGRITELNYGWPDAGDNIGDSQIDAWVVHTGFTATLVDAGRTRFSLDGAPDPANCSATYADAYYRGSAAGIGIVIATSGC